MNPREIQLHEDIKACIKCSKRFIENRGFYLKSDGKYRNTCKKCVDEQNKISKDKRTTFSNHLFREGDTCERCNIERRRIPFLKKRNYFSYEFYIKGKWRPENPPCEEYKLKNE